MNVEVAVLLRIVSEKVAFRRAIIGARTAFLAAEVGALHYAAFSTLTTAGSFFMQTRRSSRQCLSVGEK